MNVLRMLIEKSLGMMLLALSVAAIGAFSGISLIALINRMIEEHKADFSAYGFVFIGLLFALVASGVVSHVMLSRVGHSIVYRLRLSIVNRVLGTNIATLERVGAHRLYAVLTKDINDIGNAFNRLPIAIYNVLLLICGMMYLGYLSFLFLMITLGVVCLGVVVDHYISRKMYALYAKVRNTEDRLYKQYEASIEGRNELRLNKARRLHLFHHLLEPAAKSCLRTKSQADIYWAINLNWTVILIFSLMGIIAFLGISQFNVALEVVTGYILALMFLRTPITTLVDMIPSIIAGSVSFNKMSSLKLAEFDDARMQSSNTNDVSTFETLEFRQAAYHYGHTSSSVSPHAEKGGSLTVQPEYTFALQPINLHIKPTEIVFVVGGNGSGKSTFSKVLTGLYDPTAGDIFINQQRLNNSNRDFYRSHFVAVFSDVYLFDHLIDAQGEAVDDERTNHYLKRLQIDHKVSVSNGVLSTTELSQGQRKRLALLSVYLSPRPIILLDEWAADQDPIFRRIFYREILPELKAQGKTIIAVTHDDKYFDCADRIIRFDSGEMTELDQQSDSLESREDIVLSL